MESQEGDDPYRLKPGEDEGVVRVIAKTRRRITLERSEGLKRER